MNDHPNVANVAKVANSTKSSLGSPLLNPAWSSDYSVAFSVPRLNTAIATCRQVGDNGTAEMLEDILVSEVFDELTVARNSLAD